MSEWIARYRDAALAHWPKVRALGIQYGKMAALIAVPVMINGLIWRVVVVPQRAALQVQEEARTLVRLKPRLERALTDSHHVLTEDWEGVVLTSPDASVAMEAIERLAKRHRLEITDMQAEALFSDAKRDRRRAKKSSRRSSRSAGRERSAKAKSSELPIEVVLRGRFHKLAHWISDLEAQVGLRVDSYVITAADASDDAHELAVTITALLEAA